MKNTGKDFTRRRSLTLPTLISLKDRNRTYAYGVTLEAERREYGNIHHEFEPDPIPSGDASASLCQTLGN